MRGGVNGYKGFVFEELHAADVAQKGTLIDVLRDNSIVDYIITNKDGTKIFGQAKAGYLPGQIDFSKYKGQKIIVDKGNVALANDARKAGLIVEKSNVSIGEAGGIARAQQLESKILGRPTAPVTATFSSAHRAGFASAKLAAKIGVGFSIGSNIFDVLDGDKSFSEATADIVTESIVIAGTAYIGGAAFTVAGGVVSLLAETAIGASVTGASAAVGTTIAGTAIGGVVVGGIGAVTSAVAGAIATVAAAPLLPVVGATAVAGFAYSGLKRLFL